MVNTKFETFIYTYADEEYARPILNNICPFIDESHRLFRNACSLQKGKVKKDLSILDRPFQNLILIDDNIDAVKFYPQNTIQIPRWIGTPKDSALTEWLPPILDQCSLASDVRDVIKTISR